MSNMINNIFFELLDLAFIKISGPDATKLLQGQLTCDLKKIPSSEGRLAAHCQPQGRIISLFYIFCLHDVYYLLLPKCMVILASTALKKYAIFYKAEVTEETQFRAIGCSSSVSPFPSLASVKITSDSTIFVTDEPSLSFDIKNVFQINNAAWLLKEINAGIPRVYAETSGKFLPHELNLHQLGAIDFDKGCYTGQEIIARMHYKGKLKKHLYQAALSTTSAPLPGQTIFNLHKDRCEVAGEIVSVAQTASNRYEALVVLDETKAKDQPLFLEKNTDIFMLHQKAAP